MHWFLKFIFGMKICMFWTVPLSIIRSFSLYTQQWYMLYSFADSLRAGAYAPARKLSMKIYMFWTVPLSIIRSICSCSQDVTKTVKHISLLCVQWKTPDDGQRNCPKHLEFQSKNKFEKLVRLVGFIIRNLSRYTVTWTSDSEMISLPSLFETWFENLKKQTNIVDKLVECM